MHTPNVFIKLLRACNIFYSEHEDITQVLPRGDRAWRGNNWVHSTKQGHPYMVLECEGMRFSISRRRTRKNQWGYLVRWPYPASNQQSLKCDDAHSVAELIRKESEPRTMSLI